MTHKPITHNTLFYGDNLPILWDYIPTESVDLLYLDPPFNSQRTYNVLFKHESGREAVTAGYYTSPSWNQNYPTIQILTIAELLRGAQVNMPLAHATFKKAERVKDDTPQQPGLFD